MPRALTLADQVLSSVSNVLAVVLVARVMTADDFGRFALGYAVLILSLNLTRNYFGTRIALAPDRASSRRLTSDVVAALLLVSPLLVLVVFAVSALATGGASLTILAIVAFATPVVCIQDAVRFGASAAKEPRTALASDGVWVLLMLVPFLTGMALSPSQALGLWAGSSFVAMAVALALGGVRVRVGGGVAELRHREPVGTSTAVGTLLVTAGGVLVLFVVSRYIGPAAAGSLRGAATAMGPVSVLFAFTAISLTPTLVRRARAHDVSFCAGTAVTLTALSCAWGAVLLVLPAAWGVAAFGASWAGIRGVLPWTVLEYTFLSVAAAAILGLKVRRLAGLLMRQRVVAGVCTIFGGGLAAVLSDDASTVAAALAGAAVVAAVAGWVLLSRSRPGGEFGAAPDRVALAAGG